MPVKERHDCKEFTNQVVDIANYIEDNLNLTTPQAQAEFLVNVVNVMVISSFEAEKFNHQSTKELAATQYVSAFIETMVESLVLNFNEAHGTHIGFIRPFRKEN